MNTSQDRATELVKIVLNSVMKRLNEIDGKNKNALANEYKEWMVNPFFNDDVWFSTDKNLSDYIE